MRLRFLLLSSALLLGTVSCRSNPPESPEPTPAPTAGTEGMTEGAPEGAPEGAMEEEPVLLDAELPPQEPPAQEPAPQEPAPQEPAPEVPAPAQPEPAQPEPSAPEMQDPVPPPIDPQTPDELLGESSARQEILLERQRVLSAQYIKIGDEALEQADLPTALQSYSNALDVMPSSQEARERIHRVQTLMGDQFSTASDFIQDAQDAEVVRRAQARLSAENARNLGDEAMRRGDYDRAVDYYRQAQLVLRYHPLIATESLDEMIVTGLLERAQQESARAAEESVAQSRREAEAARLAQEEAERNYRTNMLDTLYQQANEAFLSENYERAEALMDQLLLEDPGNDAGERLRAAAQLARHNKRDETTRRNYREQWKRTFDELDIMDVPQLDPIVFDRRRWKEVNAREALEFVGTGGQVDHETQVVLDRLESVRFAVRFIGPDGKGSPLSEVAAFLQTLTGINFVISNKAQTELDEEALTVRLELPEQNVRKVLDTIAETSESLRWKIKDGVVQFVTKEEMLGGQVMEMYAVQDIIHPLPSFPGMEINVSPSGGIDAPDESDTPKEGGIITSDKIEGLIRNNIAPASWNDDPKNSLRIADNGTMVVYQTPEVQAQIKALLDDLREATGIMVDIQARFLTVQDNFLEDIGLDFRGLGQPGLGTNNFFNDFGGSGVQSDLGKEIGQGTDLGAFYDDGNDGDIRGRTEHLYDVTLGDQDILTNAGGLAASWTYLNDLQLSMVLRAVSKSERVELVTAPRLLVFNTARANIAVLNQVAYVKDFDVEIAQAASIADPIIDVVQDGVVLDVRPVVSADRRFVLMELRPTVATLVRPIRQQTTTLGSQNSVAIELPEVDIQRVRTTVPMPDGGTVLLGGLKVSEKQDLRSGIPILNKIPIVRALFERKGSYTSNRKLLILLEANIVIPQEREPTPAQLGSF